MTHTILKSTLAPPPVSFEEASAAFGRLVDAHLHELRTWHDHDIQVRTQQPLRRQPKPEDHAAAEEYWRAQASWHNERRARFEPYPPPIAHPDIVASVASVV